MLSLWIPYESGWYSQELLPCAGMLHLEMKHKNQFQYGILKCHFSIHDVKPGISNLI